MLLGKIENELLIIQEHWEMFPNVTFPNGVPTDEYIAANGVMKVSQFKEYNNVTHRLEYCTPYVENNVVYNVRIVPLTEQEIDLQLYSKLLQLKDQIVKQTQQRLDYFASQRGYDNVNSISKYQNISDQEIEALPVEDRALVTKFRTECRYLALATAQTWAVLYRIMNQVEAGTRQPPSSFTDIEPELPQLVWPQ